MSKAPAKKLLLISALSRKSLMGGDFFFRMPGLGLLKVAALAPPGWDVSIADEKVEPLDDEGVFDRTLEFVLKAKLEVEYFSILTPYSGTRVHRRFAQENPILTRDWSAYDANHVVFRPKKISPEKLLGGYVGALRHVYSVPTIFRRLRGTSAWKNFFYPMNLGFRQSVSRLARESI